MLLDAVLHVHTDHRNFIHNTLYIQRVLRWRLDIEEYLLTFLDVKGTNNVNYYRFHLSPPEARVLCKG